MIDTAELEATLRGAVSGEVRFDPGSRAAWSTDASNFRQVPLGVVLPRDASDIVAAVEACRRHGTAITMRGGGTSLAGQATSSVGGCARCCTNCTTIGPPQPSILSRPFTRSCSRAARI